MTIVFRASGIGHPCDRKLWYECVAGYEEERSPQTLFTFAIGTALEPVAIEFLSPPYDRWEVKYNGGSQEAEIETVIPIANGIEIRGHHDCIMRCGESEWYMVDIKTMNSFAFKGWKQHGTLRKYPQYADQLTIYGAGKYARAHNIRNLAVVALNKNKVDFPLPVDVFPWEEERFDRIRERCRAIGTAKTPPDPDEALPPWACSYCGFRGTVCHYTF